MMERWNIGFQKDISHFNFIINPVDGGTIKSNIALSQNPLFHYSSIPSFSASGG